MKEYIKHLEKKVEKDSVGLHPSAREVVDKINEIVDYLNDIISVGLIPIPDGYKED